jgi:uncharacterized phage-associated protein
MVNLDFKPVSVYSPDELEKVGNALIYLSRETDKPSKTKVLKLLYLLDEFSVKLRGFPMFGLTYKVWQLGPVCEEVFIDLSNQPALLKDYVTVEYDEKSLSTVVAKRAFDDGEFTENDMKLLAHVAKTYRRSTAKALVAITHRESSLWYRMAKEKGLLELFAKGATNNSEFTIDFKQLVAGDTMKSQVFEHYVETMETHRALRS